MTEDDFGEEIILQEIEPIYYTLKVDEIYAEMTNEQLENGIWKKTNNNEIVRAIRLCPKITSIDNKCFETLNSETNNCKNIMCNTCQNYFCLNCVSSVTGAGDHKTCCTKCKKGNCDGKHFCEEKGLQIILVKKE
jgi:hypothetical protein